MLIYRVRQIIILVSHNVITKADCPDGYHLLKCLRHFQIMDMYMASETHTPSSLSKLHDALMRFNAEIQVRVHLVTDWCLEPGY